MQKRSPLSPTNIPALTSDIYPTLLDIVGVQIPGQAPVDGTSLAPILEQRQLSRPTGIGNNSRPVVLWSGNRQLTDK